MDPSEKMAYLLKKDKFNQKKERKNKKLKKEEEMLVFFHSIER